MPRDLFKRGTRTLLCVLLLTIGGWAQDVDISEEFLPAKDSAADYYSNLHDGGEDDSLLYDARLDGDRADNIRASNLRWDLALQDDVSESSGDVDCRRCAPGHRRVRMCDGIRETECGECPDGTFNLYFTLDNACISCTSCPDGYYERNPCSPIQDVVCLPCDDKYGAFGNEDFLRKCESRTTTQTTVTITTTTTAATSSVNLITSPTALVATTTAEDPSTTRPAPPQKSGTTEGDKTPEPRTTRGEGVVPPGAGEGEPRTTSYTSEQETTTIMANYSILVGQRREEAGAATIYWPIIVGGILAALVFFVVGMLISRAMVRYRERKNKKRLVDMEDPDIQTAMLESTPYQPKFANPYVDSDDAEEKVEPTNIVDPSDIVPLNVAPPVRTRDIPTQNAVIHQKQRPQTGAMPAVKKRPAPSPPQKRSFFQFPRLGKKRKIYNSGELSYIDEHSDDEIVSNLGRPPSISYTEKRKRKFRISGGGLLGRAGRRRDQNKGRVSRSSSFQSQADSIAEETSFMDDISDDVPESESGAIVR